MWSSAAYDVPPGSCPKAAQIFRVLRVSQQAPFDLADCLDILHFPTEAYPVAALGSAFAPPCGLPLHLCFLCTPAQRKNLAQGLIDLFV